MSEMDKAPPPLTVREALADLCAWFGGTDLEKDTLRSDFRGPDEDQPSDDIIAAGLFENARQALSHDEGAALDKAAWYFCAAFDVDDVMQRLKPLRESTASKTRLSSSDQCANST